tara:strand:+ start:1899 stop:2093 length:195 start_codon:yes stop_codon:yes gene_type:complete
MAQLKDYLRHFLYGKGQSKGHSAQILVAKKYSTSLVDVTDVVSLQASLVGKYVNIEGSAFFCEA